MATTSVAMISLPQLHNSFVLPRVPNPVSVSRLMLAAGRGSGLVLEFRRILANPIDAWLWIQEEKTESSTWSVSGTERDEGVSIGVLLAPKRLSIKQS